MTRRGVLVVAISILIAGGMVFAQDQGRQEKQEGEWHADHQFLGSCGENAAVFATYTVAVAQIFHKDKRDNLVSLTNQYRTIQPIVYYLGDPSTFLKVLNSNVAMGVPGETQIDKFDFVDGEIVAYSSRGSLFQVTVPGYGRLFSETGLTVWDPTTWSALKNRGHNQAVEQDVAALCDYLSGR